MGVEKAVRYLAVGGRSASRVCRQWFMGELYKVWLSRFYLTTHFLVGFFFSFSSLATVPTVAFLVFPSFLTFNIYILLSRDLMMISNMEWYPAEEELRSLFPSRCPFMREWHDQEWVLEFRFRSMILWTAKPIEKMNQVCVLEVSPDVNTPTSVRAVKSYAKSPRA